MLCAECVIDRTDWLQHLQEDDAPYLFCDHNPPQGHGPVMYLIESPRPIALDDTAAFDAYVERRMRIENWFIAIDNQRITANA